MKTSVSLSIALLIFGLLPSSAPAQSSPEPLTAERAYRMSGLDQLEFSPDGKRLAFTVTGPREGIQMDSNIWIYGLANSQLKQYTFSKDRQSKPHWSPDGKTLAFLSNRSGKSQIHLIDLAGGEARQISHSKTSVAAFSWSPDGRQIAYSAEEAAPEKKENEKGHPRIVGLSFHRDQRHSQVWLLEVEGGKTRQLTSGNFHVAHSYWAPNLAWSPEGDSLFVSGTYELVPEHLDNRIYRVRVSDGQFTEFADPPGGFGKLTVSPDGQTLAYLGPREDAFENDDLFVIPLAGGTLRNLSHEKVDRRIWAHQWLSNSSIMILALDGFHASFYRCGLDGSVEKLPGFEVPPSGHYRYTRPFAQFGSSLVFVGETSTSAPELWIASNGGTPRKVTHFNKEWDTIPVFPLEVVSYTSFDGKKIEAGLHKPAGYKEGTRVPLAVIVHGGPSAKFSDRFSPWEQMLAARGIAVLQPNIRGSTGYGYDFLTVNRYDWGGGDFKDVMAGVDYMIEQGIADPERLGIGGWSYGGYMSTWAVTQTTRFKAAVAGAPMTNLRSEYGTEARWSHYYDTWYMHTPYEKEHLQLFIDRSPVTHVRNVETPIMLMVGERDDNTPLGQCTEFYRGLRYLRKEATLVVYPGSGHFPSNDYQRVDVYDRFVKYLVRHLK